MTQIEKYEVRIKGTRPLLHHRFPTAEESDKRKTTYDPEEEAKRGLYLKDGVPIQPSVHLEGALINAAKQFKWKGMKTMMDVFKSSVFVQPQEIPFVTPKDGKYVIDERPVKIQQSRVLSWRPRWDAWEFKFQIHVFQPENLTGDKLKEILTHAGNFVGIGDFRPKFGTFEVVEFKKVS